MEIEIAKYLNGVSDAHLSDETKAKVRSMMRQITEIESIGDSCYNIARTIHRKSEQNEDFTEEQYQHIHQMFELTDDSLTQMNLLFNGHKDRMDAHLSFNIENEINNYRNQLRNQNISDINEHKYTYEMGTLYMDIITECEKLGDNPKLKRNNIKEIAQHNGQSLSFLLPANGLSFRMNKRLQK